MLVKMEKKEVLFDYKMFFGVATIMFGLTVGTILTMFLVPAFYCILYRINPEKGE